MLTNYLLGWIAYLLAASGLMLVFWRITRPVSFGWLRGPLRGLVFVFLFTPVNIGEDSTWLVPAYLVGIYDMILGNPERAAGALALMVVAYVMVVALIMLTSLMRRVLGMGRP